MPLMSTRTMSSASGLGAFGAFRKYRIAVNITISANQTNYVLNTAKVAGYSAGKTDVTLTINSGVYVSSNTTGGPALDVDTSWNSGDTITIVNNGFVVGMGGAGGDGKSINGTGTASGGSVGSAGGLALIARRAVSINNAGTIAGGGGGGGGGGANASGSCTKTLSPGGGGGGGRSSAAANSAGGAAGVATGGINRVANPGTAGTVSSAGGGGGGTGAIPGGAGGGWGATGTAGTNGGAATGTAAGSGGAAISGNSNITWVATGTRLGAIA